MADEWKSRSEGRSEPVSIPMPKESGDGNKAADVMGTPQWGHGKFEGGSWDPSTSESEPKGSGWVSRSEDAKNDFEGED